MTVLRVMAVIFASTFLLAAHAGEWKPDRKTKVVRNTETGVFFAVPKAGPLRFRRFEADGAHFRGQVLIAGSYFYGHRGDTTEVPAGSEPSLYFVPSKKSQGALPFWPVRGPVREFYFENPDEFIKAAVPTGAAARVQQRKAKSVSGEATIWIDGFIADVECDSPFYSAKFVRVVRTGDLIAPGDPVAMAGC